MRQSTSIYSFRDPCEWLLAVMRERKSADASFSLRAFARELGYRNPSLLSEVLRGERTFRRDLADRVASGLALDESERRWLALMVASRAAGGDASVFDGVMDATPGVSSGEPAQETMTLDRFRFVADWYHFAILEMVDLRDFRADALWIAKRLGRRLNPVQVSLALERLERMGLIRRAKTGKIVKTNKDVFVGGSDVPSEAVRSHHRGMIEVAKESIARTPVDQREISGTNLTIRRSDLKRVKALVRKFHEDLHRLHSDETGDEVYRVNVQVFPLTEPIVAKVDKGDDT